MGRDAGSLASERRQGWKNSAGLEAHAEGSPQRAGTRRATCSGTLRITTQMISFRLPHTLLHINRPSDSSVLATLRLLASPEMSSTLRSPCRWASLEK